MIAFAFPADVCTTTGVAPLVMIGRVDFLRGRHDRVDVANYDLHHWCAGICDIRLLVQLALDITELRQLKAECSLDLRHRDLQGSVGRICQNLRSSALEWPHLSVHAENGPVKGKRLCRVVGRMDGVHEANDSGFIRWVGCGSLGAHQSATKQNEYDSGSKNAHWAFSLIIAAAENTRQW